MTEKAQLFHYSSGRRYGRAPRVYQVLSDGSVRVGVVTQVTVVESTSYTYANMDDFIAALGSTLRADKQPKPKKKVPKKKKLKRRKRA